MSDIAIEAGLMNRAMQRVASFWRDLASVVQRSPQAPNDFAEEFRECLQARGGEVSARNRAAALAVRYRGLDEAGKLDFLRALASFDSNAAAVTSAIEKLSAATDAALRAIALAGLRRALEPPRLKLLTAFAAIPDGVKFLVEMRAELLRLKDDEPPLQALETDLKGLLASWFDVGFLELRAIDWKSPAALLEKLVQYEAVHRIRTWRDLRNRLDSDRRCYAFFHPRMPDEPLIFVEVALERGMAASVQKLLDEKAPLQDAGQADTAVFYSINNCQRGLDGISFGNFLIKRVVELLAAEFPKLKTFCTLSPMPGFRAWLDKSLTNKTALLTAEEEAVLTAANGGAALDCARALADRAWLKQEALSRVLAPVLIRLGAQYLLKEAPAGRAGRALDPVAHFHLSNGARVERLNWRADISENGLRQSCGLMVNYLYDPASIENNHEAYVGEGQRAASGGLKRLIRA
ncbi:MAG: malonyl-CoA decarboxylase [Roseomonas sp.]|nr:malonyl-CoA decarboxylase [Roseomonas sp.]MCA3318057.1 malonyl-CoA decarboxylase [Roseomonas sp.]MCA3320777.1 malonyl-CoA decarboxylase [Roseomonas sp.]